MVVLMSLLGNFAGRRQERARLVVSLWKNMLTMRKKVYPQNLLLQSHKSPQKLEWKMIILMVSFIFMFFRSFLSYLRQQYGITTSRSHFKGKRDTINVLQSIHGMYILLIALTCGFSCRESGYFEICYAIFCFLPRTIRDLTICIPCYVFSRPRLGVRKSSLWFFC